ncbi:GrpB family protein [Desulfatibacillum aliphaticivorans]|uniref:GrpB family protein n=1 Tax=Desulfatibacillum aliphaticivorans TaxID=218208 RepID=UPI00041C68C0|nr:GrpB family protein [Desulfatibacillum aliphaticivorans]
MALKSLEQRIKEAVAEKIDMVPHNPAWPEIFRREAEFLQNRFPAPLIRRVEHFGGTAVPELTAKPIIDMLVEISSDEDAAREIVPILRSLGYDYFWRPEFDKPPMYHWFIKRNEAGERTHHIHMVEADSRLWERLLFRDYLIQFPEAAREYAALKQELAHAHPTDRIAYTRAKGEFIAEIMEKARAFFA